MRIDFAKIFTSGFLAAVMAITMLAPMAHAQAMSAEGVSTGGDKISAIVPQAANLFTVIDVMEDLSEAITDCARQGLFVADVNPVPGECRQGVPPVVDFDDSGSDTFVDVELAFGQEVPGNADTSPKGSNFVRYGGLDGEDGVATCVEDDGSRRNCTNE